jgi:hypothetical protein
MTSSEEGEADGISMRSDSPLPTSKNKNHSDLDHITRSFNRSITGIGMEVLRPKGISREEAPATKDGDQAASSNAFESDSSQSTVSNPDEPKPGPQIHKIYEKATPYIRRLFKDQNNKKSRETLIRLNKYIAMLDDYPGFQINIYVLEFFADRYRAPKGVYTKPGFKCPEETAVHYIIRRLHYPETWSHDLI